MRRCLLTFLLAVAALVLLNAQSPERLVFANVKLLDVVAGRTRPVAALVVEGAKIVAIHVTAPDQPLEGSSIRDLGGATLVPALADLAVQTQPGLDIDVDYFYAMSLAHGVMRVRAVDTHLPWAVAQRTRVGSGELLAPRVWTSGPLLDMRTPLGARNQAVLGGGLSPLVRVPDAASLGRETKSQADQRVDWVRLGENVPVEGVRAAVAAARAAKVRVSVSPLAASMLQASQAGVALIDGLGMPVRTLADMQAATQGKPNAPTPTATALDMAWAQSSEPERKALIAQLKRAGTAVAPMLASLEFQRGALADVDRDLAFLPERLRAPIQGRFVAGTQSNSDNRSKARDNQRRFVRDFVAGGGRLVTASGALADGWPIPGLGVHREIGQLIESGVSSVDALRSATAVSADVLGHGQAATWRTGSSADFFIVRADPIDNIWALTDIMLVVRAGEVLEPAQLLQQARRAIRPGK